MRRFLLDGLLSKIAPGNQRTCPDLAGAYTIPEGIAERLDFGYDLMDGHKMVLFM